MKSFEELRKAEEYGEKPAEMTHEQYWRDALSRAEDYRDGPLSAQEKADYRESIQLAITLDKQEAEAMPAAAAVPTAEIARSAPSLDLPGVADFSAERLDSIQRWAKVFLTAGVLPADWIKDPKVALARVIVCLDLAQTKGVNPLIFIQNVDFIAGRMCWKSTFVLQLLRAAGWRSYEFKFIGDPRAPEFWGDDKNGCAFIAKNPDTGKMEEGTFISVGMVKKEKWRDRSGSKWQSMPEQMFKYRSATFFCRSNAPEVMMGYRPRDEEEDIEAAKRAEG